MHMQVPRELCNNDNVSFRLFIGIFIAFSTKYYRTYLLKWSRIQIMSKFTEIDIVLVDLLRRQLHWLPVRQRISYKLAVITYKTILT